MNWWTQLKGTVKRHEPLSRHTTFKIGGAADFFIEPRDISDLGLLLALAGKYKKKFFVAGAGSNLLVSDKGFRGIVIGLRAPSFKKIDFEGTRVYAGAGAALSGLANACAVRGLSGLEFCAGIPGSVGGALIMNAGAWGKNIEDCIENIKVMDYNGNIKLFKKKDMVFAYRYAGLPGIIVLECVFKLKLRDKKCIREKIRESRARRGSSQDLSFPSAGCIFKNPSAAQPAGMLIDRCGLKGARKGGAAVSEKHANFIVNRSNATSRDVAGLMRMIQYRVRRKFGVELEPEIKIIH
ncbi:MAG: UDP-N-acetylmuramate dehydrogenase [Candidatus Omnitrophota bacterium]|jgi:UDP-N-acetylmuramate dehydrogenase